MSCISGRDVINLKINHSLQFLFRLETGNTFFIYHKQDNKNKPYSRLELIQNVVYGQPSENEPQVFPSSQQIGANTVQQCFGQHNGTNKIQHVPSSHSSSKHLELPVSLALRAG